jgi:hypothetical protein
MHLQLVIAILMSFILSSCGDVSSNQRRDNSETIIPGLGADASIVSHIHRTRGEATITYAEEIQRLLRNETSFNYRKIPDLDLDFEGGTNVSRVTQLGRPQVACGSLAEDAMNGVEARLADCKIKNQDIKGSTYLWNGVANGAAGEGIWQLVSLRGETELWKDLKTGMVWSKASGNMETGTNINCAFLAGNVSLCSGKILTWLGDDIEWRLPTRNDYLQADLDGLRLVLTQTTAVKTYWTATLDSMNKLNAWTYSLPQGQLSSSPVEESKLVRCIGTPRP